MSEPYTRTPSGNISRSGDTLDFPIFLAADPIEDDEAATKDYVDNNLAPPGRSGRIPTIANRWYLHNMWEIPIASFFFPDSVNVAAIYVGRAVTWTGIASVINAVIAPFGDLRMAIYELDEANFGKPSVLSWESADIPILAGSQLYQDTSISVQTTTAWVGMGVTLINTTKKQSFFHGSPESNNLFGIPSSRFGFSFGKHFWRAGGGAGHPPDPTATAWWPMGGDDGKFVHRQWLRFGSAP